MNESREHRPMPAPLGSVRVLDLTTVLAGPYATYQLVLLGAEVIKIERPDGGDWARRGLPVSGLPEFSAQFAAQNAGKKSAIADLKSPAGVEAVLRLAQSADVVVENFTPGVADRLGVGFSSMRARKPDIVYCAISGYGQDGEMSHRPAYDHVIQAASGVTMLTGTPETVPNRIGPPMVDYLAGIYAAFAMLAGLRERDRTGQAQFLDVAMLDTAMVAMASTMSLYSNAGKIPAANGNTAASGSSLSGIFKTGEGLLSMTANQEAQFTRAMRVLGLEELVSDPRFGTEASRSVNLAAFHQIVSARLLEHPAAYWEDAFSRAHVPATKVRTVPEMLSEPHARARGIQQQVVDRTSGTGVWVPSIGFKWNGMAIGPHSGPPRLGEHTGQFFADPGGS